MIYKLPDELFSITAAIKEMNYSSERFFRCLTTNSAINHAIRRAVSIEKIYINE